VTLLDGSTAVGSGIVAAGGTWSIAASALAAGNHSLTATETDGAGNVSPASSALSLTIKTSAPIPAGLALAAASDSGTEGDSLTNATTPTITGTGEAGDSVTLLDGGAAVGSGTVAAGGTWSIAASALAAGNHSLTATETDGAGNTSSPSAGLGLTIIPTDLSTFDTTTGTAEPAIGQTYTGPAAGVQQQYIYAGNDAINIAVSTDSWFLHGGLHDDAIQVHGGTNVLDGGVSGSKFLVGSVAGAGTDTFFLDDRNPAGAIFSTMVNFHKGDAATVFGITPQAATLSWRDNGGAAGFTGLTLDVLKEGSSSFASLALTGLTKTDLPSSMGGNDRLSLSFGTEGDGTPYLYIFANS
jgi:large repetitive protein